MSKGVIWSVTIFIAMILVTIAGTSVAITCAVTGAGGVTWLAAVAIMLALVLMTLAAAIVAGVQYQKAEKGK